MSNLIANLAKLLPADGTPVNQPIQGDFLLCKLADNEFEMSFDGGNFVPFDQGLRVRGLRSKNVQRIWLRSTNGADTNVAFYIGDVEVDDSRLNIIHDQNQLLNVNQKVPPTYIVASNFNVPANGSVIVPGTNAGNQRKDIYIRNLDPASVLAVGKGGVFGEVVDPDDRLPLETSEDVQILNQTANPIPVAVLEIYYKP